MKQGLRIIVALGLALFAVSAVSAHAKLTRATPAPNSVSSVAPTQVQLWFDEPLDLAFSDAQVLDANQTRVDQGVLQPVAGDAQSVIIPLKPLSDGSYTVMWKVLSAADGHITRGVYAFGVGDVAELPTAPIAVGEASTPNELTPLSGTARWLTLLTLLALAGAFIFRPFLLTRSLHDVNANEATRRVAGQRWRQFVWGMLALCLLANLAELFVQTNLVADQVNVNAVIGVLFASRYGALWLARVALILLSALVVGLEARGKRIPYADAALIVLGAAALWTRSLNSHATASGNLSVAVFLDWLHLVGVAVWIGGLFCLGWLLPFVWRALDENQRGAWMARLVPQFSLLALPATLVIFVTGVFASRQQIPALDILQTRALPTLQALSGDAYINTLLVKLALFAALLAFGALNLLWVSPRFRRAVLEPQKSARLFSRFRLTVGAEILLGAATIFLAGMLTLTVPPRSAPTQFAPAVVQALQTKPVALVGYPTPAIRVVLQIGPNPDAPTTFDALVTDAQGNSLPDVQRVIFNFMYLEEDAGAQNVNAEPRADNHYTAEGQWLPLEGMWKIRVTVRQKGAADVSVDLPYYIKARAAANAAASAPAAQTALQETQQAMNALTSLRMRQQLNDGAGNLALSDYAYQAPDRTRFAIQGQGESIAIGSQQYYQDKNGNWFARTRVEPFAFPNFTFADTALRVRAGRADKIDGQPAQLYLFDTWNTSGTDRIHYVYWVDAAQRVLQVGMVTASHYMMEQYSDLDDPTIKIVAPANVQVLPTVAPVATTNNSPLSSAVQGSGRPRGFITGDLEGDGALVMVVVGVIILLVGTGGKRPAKTRWLLLGLGAAAILLGVGLFIDAVNGMQAATQNAPVNVSRAAAGQQIYAQYCQTCHGEKGYGDGPSAASLPVQPFDLTTHVLLHDEQYLHAVILDGRGYMPAFGDRLSQDQILDLIAYTRLLARNAQQAGPNATPARPGFTPQP